MANPFANAPHHTGPIQDHYLLGIQAGDRSKEEGGLEEMENANARQLKSYVLSGFGDIFHYLGEIIDAAPADPEANDFFYAAASFTDASVTVYDITGTASHSFYKYRFYAWNGMVWNDITKAILENYPANETIASLVSRVTANEEGISLLDQQMALLTRGVAVRGSVANQASLPSSPGDGDMYWVIAENAYFAWSATASSWIDMSGSFNVVDTLESTSKTNALSANKGHELARRLGPFDFMKTEQNKAVVFGGDLATTWHNMFDQIPKESGKGVFLCEADSAPASSSSNGHIGEFYMDSDYFYLCIADNTWRRVALATF